MSDVYCLYKKETDPLYLPDFNAEYCSGSFGENAKQNSISCFISSAVMFTLWIVIIEIDTVFFPLVARTLCVIAWALGCELMFGSEMQSTVCGGREIIKPQDVWFDVLLNSPPLPTLCYACQ